MPFPKSCKKNITSYCCPIKKMSAATAFLIAAFVIPIFSYGNNPGISCLDIKAGLSNNEVTSIYQDTKGFMWIGTYDGLNRYDGYKFKVYRNNISNPNSIINNRINCITQDIFQNIWVGTMGGVSKYNNTDQKFYPVSFQSREKSSTQLVTGNVTVIKEDISGNVLIGSENSGLLIYAPNRGFAIPTPLSIGSKLSYSYSVSSLTIDKDGSIWVLVRNKGLCKYNREKDILEIIDEDIKNGIYILAKDPSQIWLGSDDGLYTYSLKKKTGTKRLLLNGKINHIYLDTENLLWVATDGKGLVQVDPKNDSVYSYLPPDKNPSAYNSVIYSIFEDKENRKWIGTIRSGVLIIDPNKPSFELYTHIPEKNTLSNIDFIMSFCEDDENNLWVATDGGGISKWDMTRKKYTRISSKSLKSNFITNIKKDRFNNIWVSTWGGGVSRYDKKKGSFKHYDLFNTQTNINDRFAWMFFENALGQLWVSTCNGGALYLYNLEKDKFELFDNTLRDVLSFEEDKLGNFWVGNFTSLIKIDRTTKHLTSFHIGYPVRAIHESRAGDFWIGTENGGLLRFDRSINQYYRFTAQDGLPNNAILNILEDKLGNLWMSTYNGISRFNIPNRNFSNYSHSDGLQSNQFNYNAAMALANGKFIFGGIKGFNVFDPLQIEKLPETSNPFFPIVDNLLINNSQSVSNKKNDGTASINVAYREAFIAFELVLPEYSAPDNIQYAYRLKGFEKSWNYSGLDRTIKYTGIPDDSYIFEARVTDRRGNWGKTVQLLSIVVRPPWYRTWWAYVSYLIIALILIAAIYAYLSAKRKARDKIKLANLEKEMNEKKLSFFTNISHEFRNPLTLILSPVREILDKGADEETMQQLNIVYRNAKRLLNLADQLLLLRKSESNPEEIHLSNVNFYQLCLEVYNYFLQQAKQKKIEYSFSFQNQFLELEIDREKIEIALFNILSNAFKFTPDGGRISFKATEAAGAIQITITDTGCGIDPLVGERLFENYYQITPKAPGPAAGFGIGLYLAKKFITLHNGTIRYKSSPGNGTCFSISLLYNNTSVSNTTHELALPKSTLLAEPIPDDINPEQSVRDSRLSQPAHISISEKKICLIVEDNTEVRHYIKTALNNKLITYEASNAIDGLELVTKVLPDIIISDISMPGMTGLEMCIQIKQNPSLNHIPVILLTASSLEENKQMGVEIGADDYITKPFNKEFLIARIASILQNRDNLKQYFFNTVTLKNNTIKVPAEDKIFLENCIRIIEKNLDNDLFDVRSLARQVGMSHSNLYKKVKLISGMSVTHFIRSIRLRKAAVLMIKNRANVKEAAFDAGFEDIKYFRENFTRVFGLKPSEYIKKYRDAFSNDNSIFPENHSQ